MWIGSGPCGSQPNPAGGTPVSKRAARPPDGHSPEALGRITQALLDFYDRHARELPWRGAADPYSVWVSEVMLQQTRVDTVRSYYERWLDRFPDLASLAAADLDDVLHTWAGLGYYARARNLHRAARTVQEKLGGQVPSDPDALRALPGVGDYTAGAVASIAFGRAEPAVDANARRVLARLFDLERPTPTRLRNLAVSLLDPDRPGDFNQALMELGARICTSRTPGCEVCPVVEHCVAQARGTVHDRPAAKRRRPVPEVHYLTFVARLDGGRTLVRRRPTEGLLGGMWEFPAVEIDASRVPAVGSELPPVPHVFSHLRATYHPVLVSAPPRDRRLRWKGWVCDVGGETVRTPRWQGLSDLAMPVAQQKIAAGCIDRLQAEPWRSKRDASG